MAAAGLGGYSRAGVGVARLAIGCRRVHHPVLHGRCAQHDGQLAQLLLQRIRPERLRITRQTAGCLLATNRQRQTPRLWGVQRAASAGFGRACRDLRPLHAGLSPFQDRRWLPGGAVPGVEPDQRRGRPLEQHRELAGADPAARRLGSEPRRRDRPSAFPVACRRARRCRVQRQNAGRLRRSRPLRWSG